jgi:hypothetical protein
MYSFKRLSRLYPTHILIGGFYAPFYKKVAKQGGAVAGNARRELESRTGKNVVSTDNYLPEVKKNKELKKGKEKK